MDEALSLIVAVLIAATMFAALPIAFVCWAVYIIVGGVSDICAIVHRLKG